LSNGGAIVDEVTAYRTTIPDELNSEKLKAAFKVGVDIVTFTSPSTVNNFVEVLGNELWKYFSNVRVACIGPVTLEAARKSGIDVHVVAHPHTIDALVEAIEDDVRSL
jgi:uroporphyrinogen-III synthase